MDNSSPYCYAALNVHAADVYRALDKLTLFRFGLFALFIFWHNSTSSAYSLSLSLSLSLFLVCQVFVDLAVLFAALTRCLRSLQLFGGLI